VSLLRPSIQKRKRKGAFSLHTRVHSCLSFSLQFKKKKKKEPSAFIHVYLIPKISPPFSAPSFFLYLFRMSSLLLQLSKALSHNLPLKHLTEFSLLNLSFPKILMPLSRSLSLLSSSSGNDSITKSMVRKCFRSV
jgi:hypothetical protein